MNDHLAAVPQLRRELASEAMSHGRNGRHVVGLAY
jgi:hypothetical protein